MKKRLLITLMLSLVLSVPALAESIVVKTYVLVGQSNGNGYGLAYGEVATGELIPNQDLADIEREDLITVNNDVRIYHGDWTTGLGNWDNLGPGFASWNGIRFGPELSFGNKIQAELDEPIAIIKYTPNGTSLYYDWLNNSYDLLIDAINDAKLKAENLDLTLDIQDVLWMQGESDSFGVDAPAAYEARLTSFIAQLRDGLAIPELNFHIAEIADSSAWGQRQKIWDSQAAVVEADEQSFLVESRDFPLFEDDAASNNWIHFSTLGTVMLGEAFADSVLSKDESEPPQDDDEVGVSHGYISHSVVEGGITIDANLTDWSEIPSLGYEADTLAIEGAQADFVEGWIAHDNNNLYVAYQNNGEIDEALSWPWQVYFDTDGLSSTGFDVGDNLGADYMLQGTAIFKYTGSGSDWSWQYIVTTTHAVSGDTAEFKIPRLALNHSDQLKVVFKARNAVFTGDYSDASVDTYPKAFKPIQLHSELLHSQSFVWGEPGGEVAMILAQEADAGDTTLVTTEAYALLDSQLITYLAQNGEYYTAQVASTDGESINLTTALEEPIAAGQNLWNFYGDASHPNLLGFRAVVDYTIRTVGLETLASANHLLMGDSWFDIPTNDFTDRLQERMSDALIVNNSVGGSTSGDVLNNFDDYIEGQNPDFVWVIVGINDATESVSVEDYQSNMRGVLAKIRSSGAQPIIFDSQVAQLFFGSTELTELTHDFADALAALDASVQYELTERVVIPEPEGISNSATLDIDGDLSDWDELQSFGQDANDIDEFGAKADFLEVWMAHDSDSFYIAYTNDGDIDQIMDWPWQVYLDTDNNEVSGYKVGNGVGANYLIQGGYLFSYTGTGFDWSWQFEATAEHVVAGDTMELKLPRASINNPDSISTMLKARNGVFTNNFTESGVDSFPDVDEGHFNYSFAE